MKKFDEVFVVLVGCIEIAIGLITLISLVVGPLLLGTVKPMPVFIFVLFTSVISFVLGVGILRYKLLAMKFLVFFSGYIALTKVFIFLGLLQMTPTFEVLISHSAKNIISLFYHLGIILFFNSKTVSRLFK